MSEARAGNPDLAKDMSILPQKYAFALLYDAAFPGKSAAKAPVYFPVISAIIKGSELSFAEELRKTLMPAALWPASKNTAERAELLQKGYKMKEITITAANFEEEVLHSTLPVLVDFWAVWCGPCTMQAPILAKLAEDHGDQVKIGKVNVDEEMALAQQYRVAAIPTMLLFKNGKVEKTWVGLTQKEELLSALS